MNNYAAIGFMILAAKRANLDYEVIKVMEEQMKQEMDVTTVEEAQRAYVSFN